MYIPQQRPKTTINLNKSYEGETIEQKVDRITRNREPIKDGAPIIYTKRSEGIHPLTNIRTDRFEQAIEAKDKSTKEYLARRDSIGEKAKEGMAKEAPAQGNGEEGKA